MRKRQDDQERRLCKLPGRGFPQPSLPTLGKEQKGERRAFSWCSEVTSATQVDL